MFHELKKNFSDKETSSRAYVPTARFLLHVKEENEKVSEKIAYLTFDDGPSEVTPSILDTLKEKKVKATFFLIGKEITKEREHIVKRTVAEGHSIGIHTHCHKRTEIYSSCENFQCDFLQAYQRIKEVTGNYPCIHRFPFGSMNAELKSIYSDVEKTLITMGIRSYDWNCSGEDSVGNPTTSSILRNVKKDFKKTNRPIILLHDSNATKKTALILGDIIDMIKEEGYEFDTLGNRCDAYQFPKEWRKG